MKKYFAGHREEAREVPDRKVRGPPDGAHQEEAQGGDVDVRPGLWLSSFSLVFYCFYFVSSSLHVALHLFFQLQTLYTEEGAPEVEIDLDEVRSSR